MNLVGCVWMLIALMLTMEEVALVKLHGLQMTIQARSKEVGPLSTDLQGSSNYSPTRQVDRLTAPRVNFCAKDASTLTGDEQSQVRVEQRLLTKTNTRTKETCPLQCACEMTSSENKQVLSVHCLKANFTHLPSFPEHSTKIAVIRSLVHRIEDYAFSTLNKLSGLRIESKVPWLVSDKAFWQIRNLKYLTLKGHSPDAKPFSITAFKTLDTLTSFALDRSPIGAQGGILCPLHRIWSLSLDNNGMKYLGFGVCFLKFDKLVSLTISNNPITTIGKSALVNLRNAPISSLSLRQCNLKTLGADLFSLFPSLRVLSVPDNELESLGVPRLNTGLTIITLTQNQFTKLPCATLCKMPNLIELASSHNKLVKLTLCECLKALKVLSTVFLEGSPISFIDSNLFKVFESSSIRRLSLSAKTISPDAFWYLKHLERLKLTNYLSLKTLSKGLTSLSGTNITRLDIQNTRPLVVLANDTLKALKHTKLKILNIEFCKIREVRRGAFAGLFALVELSLYNNNIAYFPNGVFKGLTTLTHLNLALNDIASWGWGSIPWGIEPSIQTLALHGNSIKYIPGPLFDKPMNLSNLSLGYNKIKTISVDAFKGTGLTTLLLNNNDLSHLPTGLLEECTQLRVLTIKNNILRIDNNPFANLEKLVSFSISLASFQDQIGHIFNNLQSLTFLNLPSNAITILPVSMFENTTNLDLLVLAKNNIISWHPDFFKPIKKLTRLTLSGNKIMTVDKASFAFLVYLRRLDLSFNPLVCNCELLWFRSWSKNVYIYLDHIQEAGTYVCAAPDSEEGTDILHFELGDDDCVDKTVLKMSISLSVSAVLVACLSLTAYIYRFHIYYVFFYVRYRRQRRLEAEDDTNYVYDAFVAYNAEDGAWVINKLLPELEYDRGYKLCLHHRDWLAGKDIVDNILTSIDSSRKVILVLSNKFASSHWCHVETTMSQNRMLDGGRNPIIFGAARGYEVQEYDFHFTVPDDVTNLPTLVQ